MKENKKKLQDKIDELMNQENFIGIDEVNSKIYGTKTKFKRAFA